MAGRRRPGTGAPLTELDAQIEALPADAGGIGCSRGRGPRAAVSSTDRSDRHGVNRRSTDVAGRIAATGGRSVGRSLAARAGQCVAELRVQRCASAAAADRRDDRAAACRAGRMHRRSAAVAQRERIAGRNRWPRPHSDRIAATFGAFARPAGRPTRCAAVGPRRFQRHEAGLQCGRRRDLESRRLELEQERFHLVEQVNAAAKKLKMLRAERDAVERQRARSSRRGRSSMCSGNWPSCSRSWNKPPAEAYRSTTVSSSERRSHAGVRFSRTTHERRPGAADARRPRSAGMRRQSRRCDGCRRIT